MKHIKKYEQIDSLDYEIYYSQTKDGIKKERIQYNIVFDIDVALKKVQKLINSFLTLDKTAPRFEHWNLDDYWIEIYKGDEKIQIIDKEEIDARFEINKYNL